MSQQPDDPAAMQDTPLEGEPTQGAPAAAPDPVAVLSAQKAELEKSVAELKDRLLRNAAEFENAKKRMKKDVEDAQHHGREKLLKELLGVTDAFAMALKTMPDDNPVAKGVRMVEKQMLQTLEKFGLTRFSAVGEVFNPARHEAIQQVPSELPVDTVVAEFASGWMFGDRLFRAAMVSVSQGRPEPSA